MKKFFYIVITMVLMVSFYSYAAEKPEQPPVSRIVDPQISKPVNNTPKTFVYEQKTWGPKTADTLSSSGQTVDWWSPNDPFGDGRPVPSQQVSQPVVNQPQVVVLPVRSSGGYYPRTYNNRGIYRDPWFGGYNGRGYSSGFYPSRNYSSGFYSPYGVSGRYYSSFIHTGVGLRIGFSSGLNRPHTYRWTKFGSLKRDYGNHHHHHSRKRNR